MVGTLHPDTCVYSIEVKCVIDYQRRKLIDQDDILLMILKSKRQMVTSVMKVNFSR